MNHHYFIVIGIVELNINLLASIVTGLDFCVWTLRWFFKWSTRRKTWSQVSHLNTSCATLCCSRRCLFRLLPLLKVLLHSLHFMNEGRVLAIYPSLPKCSFRWAFMWSSLEKVLSQKSQTESRLSFLCWVRVWRLRLKTRSKVASNIDSGAAWFVLEPWQNISW